MQPTHIIADGALRLKQAFAGVVFGFVGLLASAQSGLLEQEIQLGPGWNLISIQVAPAGFAPIEIATLLDDPDKLVSIWGYDASAHQWQSYQPLERNYRHDLTRLVPGRGYWIEMAKAATLRLAGPAWDGRVHLMLGWNLAGFGGALGDATEELTLASIFRDELERVPQVWTYEGGTLNRFVGYDTIARPPITELSGVEAGRGYWVFSLAPFEIRPGPALVLTPDSDMEPLASHPDGPEAAVPAGAEDKEAGLDLNDNGDLDSPYTQNTIFFAAGVSIDSISILNTNGGAFAWSIDSEIPWLEFDSSSGVTATETDTVRLTVHRGGLLPGITTNHFTVHLGDISRQIGVRLQVPTAQGDYRGSAEVQRVNGKDIPLGKVDLHLSLYDDSTSNYTNFHAVISREKALLFPQDILLKGVFYSGNDLTLTTTFQMPAADRNSPPYDEFKNGTNQFNGNSFGDIDVDGDRVLDNLNLFPFAIRRQITLIGTRKDDGLLEGSYIESIQDALPNGQPIYLEGAFTLVRESLTPTLLTAFNASSKTVSDSIGGSAVLGYTNTIRFEEAVRIQTVTVKVTADYPTPSELRYTLIGPTGRQAPLEIDASAPGLFHANGFGDSLGNGDWSLVVTWNPDSGERGFFLRWELGLVGVVLRSVKGLVALEGATNVPPVAQVTLIGSNVPQFRNTEPGGEFLFGELTEDSYQVGITKPGYQTLTTNFFLGGIVTNKDLGTFVLKPLANTKPVVLVEPPFGAAPLTVTFTPLIPLSLLDPLGPNPSVRWDFGDGSTLPGPQGAPLSSVEHTFVQGGFFPVELILEGGGETRTYTASVLAHALGPNPATPALAASEHFIHSIGFIGSLASTNNKATSEYLESQRDVAGFDINRDFGTPGQPDEFRPRFEDTDFLYQTNSLVLAPGLPPQPLPDSVIRRYPDEDAHYTTYDQPTVNGIIVPDRFRMVVTLGGFVFPPEEPPGRPWKDNTPRVANLKLQVGRIEP